MVGTEHPPARLEDFALEPLFLFVLAAGAGQAREIVADGEGIRCVIAQQPKARLDLSAFEERFTAGDAYLKTYYSAYFEKPFRQATMKDPSGEPMVALEPNPEN